MQNLTKVKDGFVQHIDSKQPTDTRFIRLESPDADVRMTVAFPKSGQPYVGVFATSRPSGYWDPIGAPQFYVKEDDDGAALQAGARIPGYRISAGQADAIAAYVQRVDRNLKLMDAVIARIRAGDQFLDDAGKES